MTLDQSAITTRIERSARTIGELRAQSPLIAEICAQVRKCLRADGTVYTCGNGGSAAEAMHLTEELIGRYRYSRPPYAAICLNADATAITCIANDFGFDQVFARQVEALCGPDDILIVFSTSGNSPNIVNALQAARRRGARTIGLLGKGGGPCAQLCESALVVASEHTEHVQEAHQVILHLILEAVESP